MKIKKKAAVAAAVFAVTMNLSACAYGPPPEEHEDIDADISQTEYDPEENQNATVYGPPADEQ